VSDVAEHVVDAGKTATPSKPCCARLSSFGGWCVLDDGHAGDHVGVPMEPIAANTFMPRKP
jgi:hypothetical protein